MTRSLAHPPLRLLARCVGAAVALLCLAAGAVPALAADAVQARAYQVDDGARLVFDWPEPVDFVTTTTPTRLTISFARPLAASFEAALANLGDRVSDIRITGNGQAVELTFARPLFASAFAHENLVVVDLMPLEAQPPAAVEAAAPPEPVQDPGPTLVVVPGQAPSILTADPPAPPTAAPVVADAVAAAAPPPRPAPPAAADAGQEAADIPGLLSPDEVPIAPSALAPASGPAAEPAAEAAAAPAAQPATVPQDQPAPDAGSQAFVAPAPVIVDGMLSVRYGLHDAYDRIVFDWPERVPYTADTSGGVTRIQFEAEARIDADRLAARLPDRVRLVAARAEDGALEVVLAASPGARVKVFYNLTKVVVDVFRDPAGAPPVEVDPATLAPLAVAAAPAAAPAEDAVQEDEPTALASAEPAAEAAVPTVPPPPFPPAVRSDPVPEAVAVAPAATPAETPETAIEAAAVEDRPADAAEMAHAGPDQGAAHPEGAGDDAVMEEEAELADAGHATQVATAPPAADPPADPAADRGPAADPAHAEAAAPHEGTEVADASTERGQAAGAEADAGEDAAPVEVAEGAAEMREPGSLEIVVIGGETETLMRLRWSEPTRAAVVKRNDRIWVSFDREAEDFSLEPLTGPMDDAIRPLYEDPAVVEAAQGLVFSVRVPPAIEPRVTATGNTWYIQLRPRSTELAEVLAGRRFEDPVLGPAIAYEVADPGEPILLEDPQVGDHFVIVPSGAPGYGVAEGASFVQFATMATAQGLAFERLSDDVVVRRQNDRVEVVASGGLTLSDDQAVRDALERAAASEHADASGHDAPDPLGAAPAHADASAYGDSSGRGDAAAVADADPALPRGGANGDFRLFDPQAWRASHRGSLDDVRRTLQERAARARDDGTRAAARAEYARYLFARGQYRDAGGMLRLIASEMPQAYERDASLLALRGAVALLNGMPQDALNDLSDRRLLPSAEAQYWRAAALAALGRLDEAAEVYAGQAMVPDWYPRDLSIPLALAAADAALAIGDLEHAAVLLDQLPYFGLDPQPAAEIGLRRAEVLWRAGDTAGADEQWADVEHAGLSGPTARAVLARARAHYEAGVLEPAAAAAALDAVRFHWRGGPFEMDLLQQLAAYQLDAGDFRAGIQTLRHVRSLFPGHEAIPLIEARMMEAFADLFGPEPPANVSPVTAIALFSEFRDLAPQGPEGMEMLRRLAGRLVAIGLDADAAEVLGTLLDQDLERPERAALGRDLAILYLADRSPERAVQALMQTRVPRMSAAIAAERRHLLASAQLAQDDYAAVLDTLDGDLGRPASMLRAEANWRLGDWAAAAEAFGRLVEGDDFAWPPVPGSRMAAPAAEVAMAGEIDAEDATAEGPASDMMAEADPDATGMPPLMSAEEAAAMDAPATPDATADAARPAAPAFVPHGEPLDAVVAEQVLNWAMALTYAEDASGLAYLRDVYGTTMNDTAYGATFRLLTASDLGPINSVADLGRIGANIDLFSQFLDSYRARLEEELAPADDADAVEPVAMDGSPAVTG